MRPDVSIEHRRHHLVGDQQEVVVGTLDGVGNLVGLEAVVDGFVERCVAHVADHNFHAAVAHV